MDFNELLEELIAQPIDFNGFLEELIAKSYGFQFQCSPKGIPCETY